MRRAFFLVNGAFFFVREAYCPARRASFAARENKHVTALTLLGGFRPSRLG